MPKLIKHWTTADGAERLRAAHERYVTALRQLNSLRCRRGIGERGRASTDYASCLNDAYERVNKAIAEWTLVFERETGRKLASESGLDSRANGANEPMSMEGKRTVRG